MGQHTTELARAGREETTKWIRQLANALFQEASQICFEYWRTIDDMKDRPLKEQGNYHLRCDAGKAGFVAYWSRSRLVWLRKQKRYARRSEHIKIGDKNRYAMGHFKAAHDWEYELIDRIEVSLELLRAEAKWLQKVANALANHPQDEHIVQAMKTRKRRPARTPKGPATTGATA